MIKNLPFVLCLGILCSSLLLSGCSSLNPWTTKTSALDEVASLEDEAGADDDEADEEEDAESLTEPKDLDDYDKSVRLRKQWRSSAGEESNPILASLQPVILGEHIYTADFEGLVSAFTLADGDRVWRVELDSPLTGGVGAGAGLVLVGSSDGDVVALAADTGEERWRAELTSEVLAPPAAAADIVVVQTQDGKVHGLAATSGELVWRYASDIPVLTLRGTGAPVLVGKQVVLGFASGKVVALNSASGELLWETKLVTGEGKTELERMVDVNTPVLAGDIVYATSYQGKLGAISRGAGRELWAHKNSSYRAPSLGRGRLYVVDAEDKLFSFRASGGREVWVNEDLMRRKLTEPLALNDHVAVADIDGYLHILSSDDGQIVGRTKVDGDGVSVAMLRHQNNSEEGREEWIFVLDNSGDLTAYELEVEADK